MKKSRIAIALPALLLGVTLTGCSLFKSNKTVINPSLPQDRENIAVKADPATYTPDELRRGVVKGDWAIETVYGKDAVGEKAPYLKFVPSEKRVYGNNGCNVINATYTYNPQDSTLSFGSLASTMMLCQMEGLTDYDVNTALGAVKYYDWNMDGDDYRLTLLDESRSPVMTLMHQNFQFLNGTWKVTKINNEAVNVEGMKLVIDVDEAKLHGNTGCNIINGEIEVDMDAANSISFSAIAMTRAMCHDSKYETALVVALEEVSAARPVSGTEVILYDTMKKPVLTLVRSAD